jgi:calcium-dependent protein kinase
MGSCGSKKDVEQPREKPKHHSKALLNIKVSPDIFVSLKQGSLSQYYRIGEVLGEGGFGCVRIATQKNTGNGDDLRLGIIRAIKQIRKDKILKEDEQLMFAEVDLLKELDHPNIVKLYELYQDNKNYYLITE